MELIGSATQNESREGSGEGVWKRAGLSSQTRFYRLRRGFWLEFQLRHTFMKSPGSAGSIVTQSFQINVQGKIRSPYSLFGGKV
jgi:hypothetical protein